jgi:predicted anti-sigma-YlaC factor YlaD
MHREIRDHIEDVLRGGNTLNNAREHLAQCDECRSEVQGMQEQTALIRELQAPEDFAADLRPGFYARVMERIEAEGPISIWNLFIESAFGRRIAMASLALALLIGVYVVTSERSAEESTIALQSQQAAAEQTAQETIVAGEDAPAREITQVDQSQTDQSSQDAVLANLVTYREQ